MEEEGPPAKVLLADKGYDADFIRQDMEWKGGFAMIPTKRNRNEQIPVDPAIYAMRNVIERCFNKLKNAHRLATRYLRQDRPQLRRLRFHLLNSALVQALRMYLKQFVNKT